MLTTENSLNLYDAKETACCYVFVAVDCAVMNIAVQVAFSCVCVSSFECIPRSGIVEPYSR